MKKILIANAVATNNGDAALVFVLKDKLIDMGYDVAISSLKSNTLKSLYPDIEWIKAEYEFNRFYQRIFRRLPRLKKIFLKSRVLNNKVYKDIDVIISAPGGYVNSYYGIEDRFYCMKLAKEKFNTKLVMYSQSVGPLNSRDKEILDKYMDMFDLFMARDEISYNNVKQYKNVIRTNDAAFLLDSNRKDSDNYNNDVVGISVREWRFDGRNKDQYVDLIKNIVIKCIENGNKVEFISTCQGLDNYIDDSSIANYIREQLDEKYKEKVYVNRRYYSLNELREYICKFKFVVGTRLHMCILSIIAGIPAFNISYEVKGRECFKILNLNEYSIDYNDEINSSLEKLQLFIDNNQKLKEVCIQKSVEMNDEANKYFNYMTKSILES